MKAPRPALFVAVVALATLKVSPCAPRLDAAQAAPLASDAEIRRMLVERIDVQRQSVGIVAGVVEPAGRRVVSYGSVGRGDTRPLNGDTVFEIGSITKVFTSLLLAEAVQRREVSLADPISKFLPEKVKVPERGGRAITLQELSMHTSGLPRLPANMKPKDPANPYADYSVEDLYSFISAYQLTRDPGARYEYSNLGGGLLGHVLSLRAGTEYEALVRTRITDPLGMTSTSIALTPAMRGRLAQGHSATLQPVDNWDLPTLAGAGALRSTANDLLAFVAANLGLVKTSLAPAMASMLEPRQPTGMPAVEIALGWHVSSVHGKTIVWHNGGTGGYRTFIGFDPAARAGVAVLSNAGTAAGPDDIGRHILDPETPLLVLKPPSQHTETTINPKLLDRYVGRYQLATNVFLTVARSGDRLNAQLTGQPAFEIFPESETQFFLKVVEAQLTFELGADGKASAVVLHQNGASPRAPRVE